MSIPDFSTMTRDQIAEWVQNNDIGELLRHGERVTDVTFTRVESPMKTTSIRLPEDYIEMLEQHAGRDREGKSGVVRKALAEYFTHHPEAA